MSMGRGVKEGELVLAEELVSGLQEPVHRMVKVIRGWQQPVAMDQAVVKDR